MISLRLRAIILFVFIAIFMWFTMTMVAQQLFIFRKHRSNLNSGDQGVLQGKDVHFSWRVSKTMKTDSRTVGRDTNHAKWNGISEEKIINDGTQRHSGKVRLLCWVMTSPKTLGTKAERVARTWAKKCSQTLFMSSQNNTTFPGKVIGLNVKEGRNALWKKTRLSLKYIYDHHFDEADWFFKADDDTYVIVENLMAFLSEQDPNKPVFFGFNFVIKMPYYGRKLKRIEYMSGGAGYALSREALKRFVEVGLKEHPRKCPHNLSDWPEDVNLGICMESLGVLSGDTRDQWGRFRFIPTNLHYFVDESVNEIDWLRLYSKYNISVGRDCCSDSLISFHYVQPGDMVIFDFLVNNVKVDPRDL